jgi:hypothetical protein
MNKDVDYSAAYVVLRTDDPELSGHGFTFTIVDSPHDESASFLFAEAGCRPDEALSEAHWVDSLAERRPQLAAVAAPG